MEARFFDFLFVDQHFAGKNHAPAPARAMEQSALHQIFVESDISRNLIDTVYHESASTHACAMC